MNLILQSKIPTNFENGNDAYITMSWAWNLIKEHAFQGG